MFSFKGVSKRITDFEEFETIINNVLSNETLKNKCDFSIKSKIITTREIFKLKQFERVDKNVRLGLGLLGTLDHPIITLSIPVEMEKIEVMIDRGYGVHFYITIPSDIIEIYIDNQQTIKKDFDFELIQVPRKR